MKINKHLLIAFLILLLGIFLRFYMLGRIPSGFFRDEAAIGYNAFSIWNTGKDEFGMSFPKVFRSFEVFFLPLYIYLSAPIVGIFGLSEITTRLLSSFAGFLGLIIIFLIGKKIWGKHTALFALFILTISPWHIFYSRGAFEGNLALSLFASGFLFWLYFLQEQKTKYFFISILSFAASMYSYQSSRIVIPLFALIAILISYNILWRLKQKLIIPIIIVALFLIPLFSLSFKAGGYHRAFGVSIFRNDINPPGWIDGESKGLLTNNNFYLRVKQVSALYLSYFSPRNLFIEGDWDKQRSVEHFSVFYAWLFPFMIYGLWKIIKKSREIDKLLISWILIAPIPASMTGDPFHTYRSLLLYFPLTLLAGIGLAKIYSLIKFKKLYLSSIIIMGFTCLSLFIFSYVLITPAKRARYWDYGYKDMMYILQNIPDAKRIVIDDPATESYIHLLFFTKVNPEIYQKYVFKLGPLRNYYYSDPSEIRPSEFGKYEFKNVSWAEVRGDKGTVFVFTAKELPVSEFKNDPNVELLNEIMYPNGDVAYRIVKIL